jgi:hypothetical protein
MFKLLREIFALLSNFQGSEYPCFPIRNTARSWRWELINIWEDFKTGLKAASEFILVKRKMTNVFRSSLLLFHESQIYHSLTFWRGILGSYSVTIVSPFHSGRLGQVLPWIAFVPKTSLIWNLLSLMRASDEFFFFNFDPSMQIYIGNRNFELSNKVYDIPLH